MQLWKLSTPATVRAGTLKNEYMKKFTYNKIGYTSGVYGCSNEYFLFTIITSKNINQIVVSGMYGVEDRIKSELEKLGFEMKWCISSPYGKMTRNDIARHAIHSEYELVKSDGNNDVLKSLIK